MGGRPAENKSIAEKPARGEGGAFSLPSSLSWNSVRLDSFQLIARIQTKSQEAVLTLFSERQGGLMNSQPSGAMPPNFSSLNQTAQDAGLSLKRILPEAKPIGGSDLQIQSCCGSWQEIQPNDLYVAIVSADADGHGVE